MRQTSDAIALIIGNNSSFWDRFVADFLGNMGQSLARVDRRKCHNPAPTHRIFLNLFRLLPDQCRIAWRSCSYGPKRWPQVKEPDHEERTSLAEVCHRSKPRYAGRPSLGTRKSQKAGNAQGTAIPETACRRRTLILAQPHQRALVAA